MEIPFIILALCVVTALVIIFRYIGAWMFRIDDLIAEQKKTNKLLEEMRL